MLSRLGIRQKLTALAALPMVAVLLTMAPFVFERARDASLARTTANTADAARDVGQLVQELQQERLLSLAFLTSQQLDRTAFVAQTATSAADVARLRDSPATAAVITGSERSLTNLAAIRILTINRGITAETAYQAYRRAIADLINNLRLTNPSGVDTAGISQLQALDELSLANEEASSVGATLVAVAGDSRFPLDLVNEAVTAQAQHADRLNRLISPDQAQYLNLVEQGTAGDRITQLVAAVNRGDRGAPDLTVADTLSAAVSYTTLRQVAQDRITRDVADAATRRATSSQRIAIGVGVLGLVVLLLVFWLARTISRSIAGPIRRLTRAAADVATQAERQLVRIADADVEDPGAIQLTDVAIASTDELGELAGAFNRVQATAAALVEQQVNSRRNVAVMFANIARRTQNLVGRQRTQLQALRRYVADPRGGEQLARLDLQRTQLRRTADSLLVVSGIVDQGAGGTPALLADLVGEVVADLGPEARVEIRMVVPVAVTAGLVDDLRLVLAELLANAVNFSPPGTSVELTAELRDGLMISIVDHGLGMTSSRLDEENRRLVGRERLDIAPTSVLGLFVVGRLARRHGLTVALLGTPGGGITAQVHVPAQLLGPASVVDVVRRAAVPVSAGLPAVPGSFDWFGLAARTNELPALPAWPPPAPLPAGPPAPRPAPAGPVALPPGPALPPAPRPAINGNGARPGPEVETRAGLTRRRPGTHMAPGLLVGQPAATAPAVPTAPADPGPQRDPESERAQLDSLFAGFQRGETSQQPAVTQQPPVEGPS